MLVVSSTNPLCDCGQTPPFPMPGFIVKMPITLPAMWLQLFKKCGVRWHERTSVAWTEILETTQMLINGETMLKQNKQTNKQNMVLFILGNTARQVRRIQL